MRSRTVTSLAHYATGCAAFFFMVGFAIPFWFGRASENSALGVNWGLWFLVVCGSDSCASKASALRTDSVFLTDENSNSINVLVITILATLSMAVCLLALVFITCVRCCSCMKLNTVSSVLVFSTVLLFNVVVVTFVVIILAAMSLAAFFSKDGLDAVSEFPWSVLCYGVGAMFSLVAGLLYAYIINRWRRFGYLFSHGRVISQGKHFILERHFNSLPEDPYDPYRENKMPIRNGDVHHGFTNRMTDEDPKRHDEFSDVDVTITTVERILAPEEVRELGQSVWDQGNRCKQHRENRLSSGYDRNDESLYNHYIPSIQRTDRMIAGNASRNYHDGPILAQYENTRAIPHARLERNSMDNENYYRVSRNSKNGRNSKERRNSREMRDARSPGHVKKKRKSKKRNRKSRVEQAPVIATGPVYTNTPYNENYRQYD